MNLVGIGISAFIVALSGALMPGPLLAVTVSEAARRGARAGPLIVFGHGLLEIVLIALVIAGLGKFITQPLFKAIASLAGGVMLIVMGSMMLAARNKFNFNNIETNSRQACALWCTGKFVKSLLDNMVGNNRIGVSGERY